MIEGISQIILDNKELISDFADAGWKVLQNYMYRYLEALNPASLDRVFWLCDKLNELLMLLHPSPLVSTFMTMSTKRYVPRDIRSTLKRMEKSFADEIAVFYYMNLHNDSNIRISKLRKYHDSLGSSKALHKTPKQCLSLLLEQDKEKTIREWFCKWMADQTRLQNVVLDSMKTIA